MNRVRIDYRGPFDLRSSKKFLCAFTPAAGSASAEGDALELTFRADRSFEAVFASARQEGDSVVVELEGARDEEAASRQVARILSLDHDATGWAALVRKDEVLSKLVGDDLGFRPPVFPSPYEAALWGVLAQRTPMSVAASWKRALARELGETRTRGGVTLFASPHPAKLFETASFQGIPALKMERLRHVAAAALDGTLDADRLRSLEPEVALASLRELPGFGPWTSQHVLMRGTGPADAVPDAEPRLGAALQSALHLDAPPTPREIGRLLERFRPWRMWASVALVRSFFATSRAAGRAPRRAPRFGATRAVEG